MQFNQSLRLSKEVCESFWKYIDDSYRIEQLFEESQNVKVTLKDKFGTCTFIYFKGKQGRAIRVLDNEQQYVGVLWIHENGEINGSAEGEKGKRRVTQTLKMFQKSLDYGIVDLVAEKNPLPPSAQIPLSPREKTFVELLKNGIPFPEVKQQLELTPLKLGKIRRSLIRKGIIESSFEEIA